MLITSCLNTKTSLQAVHTQQSFKKIIYASVRWVGPRKLFPTKTRMLLTQDQWAKLHLLDHLQPVENHQRSLIPVFHLIPWIIRQALILTSKWILRRVKLRHSIIKPVNRLYQNQIRKGVKTTPYKRRGSLNKWVRVVVGIRTSLCRIAPTRTTLIASVR